MTQVPNRFPVGRSAAFPLRLAIVVATAMTLSGCEAIGTIFEAGVWMGVIVVIGIVAVVAVIAAMFRR